jgi:hypothetical protein
MVGLSWEHWRGLTAAVEQLGFDGPFRSDHFTPPVPVDLDSLEHGARLQARRRPGAWARRRCM